VLLKSGGYSFTLQEISRSRLPTIWPGHAGDVHIKPLHDCAITNTEALSPAIYNCRTSGVALASTWLFPH
jgi:hypothetical protein